MSELAKLFNDRMEQNEITERYLTAAWQSDDDVRNSGEMEGFQADYGLRCDLDGMAKSLACFLRENISSILEYDPEQQTVLWRNSPIMLLGYFNLDDVENPSDDFWKYDYDFEILRDFESLVNYDDDEENADENTVFRPSDLAALFSEIRKDDQVLNRCLTEIWDKEDSIEERGELQYYSVNYEELKRGNVKQVLADFIKEKDDPLLSYNSNKKTVSFGESKICDFYEPLNPE